MIMVGAFVIAVIAAILLAWRFEVFVLLPATLLTAAAIIAVGHQPRVMLALTLLGTVGDDDAHAPWNGGVTSDRVSRRLDHPRAPARKGPRVRSGDFFSKSIVRFKFLEGGRPLSRQSLVPG